MPDQGHIHSAFDRDLETIQGLIVKMGGLVEQAIEDSMNALVFRDTELAGRIVKGDEIIDDLEEKINHEAARVIALRAPTASDLRTILSVMKIAVSLERSGDFAKNLAKRTKALEELPPITEVVKGLQRMAHEVQALLKDALDAFIRRDVALAEQVRDRDQDVDALYNSVFRELLTHMMEDPRQITAGMHLHFIAKNIERTGDHVATIADQVVYLVTGQLPTGNRPKEDTTSYEVGA